jgi:hypothetical protein
LHRHHLDECSRQRWLRHSGASGLLSKYREHGDSTLNIIGGSVGIGTTSPVGTLEIHATTNENIYVSNSQVLSGGITIQSVNDANSVIQPLQISASLFYLGGGNIGIGTTSPQNLLDVNGAASIGYNVAAPTNGLIVNGSVGIGTASPGAPLEVYGSDSSSNKIFTVVSTAGTTAMAIGSSTVAVGGTSTITYNNDIVSTGSEIDLYAGTTKVFQIGAGDGNDVSLDTNGGNFYFGANHSHSGFFFDENSTVLERIDSSGHVGIGTSAMASKLEVNGNAAIGYVDTSAPTNGLLVSGNVGIGTASPGETLDVYGGYIRSTDNFNSYAEDIVQNNNTGTTAGATYWAYNSANYALYGIMSTGYTLLPILTNRAIVDASGSSSGIAINNEGAEPIVFGINSAEKMRVDTTGNVGIGSTVPAARLDIVTAANNGINLTNGTSVGQLFNDANFHIEAGAGGTLWLNGNSTAVTFIGAGGGTTGINTNGGKVQIASTGSVGIGTGTIANKLDVNGSASIGYQTTAAPTNGLLVSGNVGIGTTLPSYTLDVTGTARIGQTTGTPLALLAIGTSGHVWEATFLDPSISAGNFVTEAVVGEATSTYNSGFMEFSYVGSGSSSNALT